jgi:hypothetical protein
LSIFTAKAARDVTVSSAGSPVNAATPTNAGAGSNRAKPLGRGSAEGRMDRAGSVVGGGWMVDVVVVELVVDGVGVVATTTVVGGGTGEVVDEVDGVVVSRLVVDAAVDGGVVVGGEPAAASLHAEISKSAVSKEFDKLRLRPAMRGDHTEQCGVVRLTMVTIHITISIDTDSDQDSANVLGERLKDAVWKEVYENMQLPASVATSYAEVS